MTSFIGSIVNVGVSYNEETPTYLSDECESARNNIGAISGSVVGGVCAFFCLGACIYFVCLKAKSNVEAQPS